MSLNSEISIIVFHIVYNTWKKLLFLYMKDININKELNLFIINLLQ